MEDNVPEWASRHHYFHHSNSKGKTKAQLFFEKCHRRPAIKLAEDIIDSPEATDGQKKDAQDVINRLHFDYNGSDNAAMLSGRLTQQACDDILIKEEDVHKAIDKVLVLATNYIPRSWDNGVDAAKKDQFITELPEVIKNSVIGLREAMATDNQIIGEIKLFDKLPGNRLKYMTLPDYGRRGDLKTKWSKVSKTTKSGFATHSLPANVSYSIWDQRNVSQVAGFWALNGNKPPFLLYANKLDYRLFTPENCDELTDEYLQCVVDQTVSSNKAIELSLKNASTKKELIASELLDTSDWLDPPTIINEAKNLWRMYHETNE